MTQNQTSNSQSNYLNHSNLDENFNINENDFRTDERNEITIMRNVAVEEGMRCTNCQRQQHMLIHQRYHLSFILCTRYKIRSFQKLRFDRSSWMSYERVILCKKCFKFIVSEDKKTASDNHNTWPSFFWELLKNERAQQIYLLLLWLFILLE